MKGAIICQRGVEKLLLNEVFELIGARGKEKKGHVVFEFEKIEDLMKLAYKTQLGSRVLIVDMDCKGYKTFALRAESDLNDSKELEAEKGAEVAEKTKLKVDLENPDLLFYYYEQEGDSISGVDLGGNDLGKREYRIYQTRQALRATTCKALVDISGFRKGIFVNVNCGEGIIGIEAYCKLTGKSVRFFEKDKLKFKHMFDKDWDKLFSEWDHEKKFDGDIVLYDDQFRHIDNAKKNAKIAGIKGVKFSRLAIEWLDTKHGKEEVDALVCYPMQESRINPKKKVQKQYKELFYQCKFVMKGKVVVLMREKGKLEQFAEGFKLTETHEIQQGKDKYYVEVFERES